MTLMMDRLELDDYVEWEKKGRQRKRIHSECKLMENRERTGWGIAYGDVGDWETNVGGLWRVQ